MYRIANSIIPQQTIRYFSTTVSIREKQQFLAVLKDFTDDKALERRLSVREKHLEKARQAKIDDVIKVGGAILDSHKDAKMQGSFLILNANSMEEAEEIVKNDIYYKSKVWEKVELYPIKVAPLSKFD